MGVTLNLPRNTTLYSLARTNTFRAAHSSLFENKRIQFPGYGTNLGNITAKLRAIYVADDGCELGQVDQAGAEARIVAFLSRLGKYRDLFLNDIKVHSYVALHLFKDTWIAEAPTLDIGGLLALEPKELKQHPDCKAVMKLIKSSDDWPASRRFYYIAKQTCHSANYGIKGPTFALNTLEKSGGKIALSRRDADYFLTFYRSMFPEIVDWNIRTYAIYQKANKLYNLFGHPREFTGDEDAEKVYAFIPQSTVGEITHVAIRECQNYIEANNRNWHILQNNHDSFLMEFPINERKEAIEQMRKSIEIEFISPYDGTKFAMKSEAKVGQDWFNMVEV